MLNVKENQSPETSRLMARFDRLYRVVGALAFALAALIAPQNATAQEARAYTVVAATTVAAKGFDDKTLARVMLGRARRVAGKRVAVVMVGYETPAIKAFLKEVVEMGRRRYETYWRKRLFSSRGTPPRVVNTVDEALAIVARTPGTIAIVPAETPLPAGLHAVAHAAPVAPAAPVTAPAPAPVVPVVPPAPAMVPAPPVAPVAPGTTAPVPPAVPAPTGG